MKLDKVLHVLAYCRIKNNIVIVNGLPLYFTKDEDCAKWFSNIYHEQQMQFPKFFKMDNLCKTGFLCSELLLKDIPFNRDVVKPDWSVVCVERSSSLDDDKAFQNTINKKDNYFPSPAVFVYTLANIVTGELSIRYKLGGESSCYVVEKLDPLKFISLMQTPFMDMTTHYVLGGWVDYADNQCDAFMMLISDVEQSDILLDEDFVKNYYFRNFKDFMA